MSHKVTFNVADSEANVLGCDVLLDEFTTAEFETGTLTGVEAYGDVLVLEDETNRIYHLGHEVIAFEAGINTPTWSKESDHLYLSEGGRTRTEVTIVTESAIDLTDVNTITVDWTSYGYNSSNNETRVLVITDKAHGYGSAVAQLSYTGIFSRRENELDVSGLSGNYYLAFSKRKDVSWGSACEGNLYKLYLDDVSFSTFGNRVSPATDVGAYGATGPDLKIKWTETVPDVTTLTIETGTSDSDATPPSTWHEQSNGESITNLPADLTDKYLWYKATLQTTDDSVLPTLEWVCIYDANDNPLAAVRVDFNGEVKAVPASGTVEFLAVDPGTDIPYTVYIFGLGHTKIAYDEVSGTVTVVDTDETENVTFQIVTARITQSYIEVARTALPAARVTQSYIEVALGEDLAALPAARVTQFYIEAASPHWEYDLATESLRFIPELSAPLFGLDLSVEALSMRLSPQLSEAPLYMAYELTAHESRLLSRLSEARINTQGLCIFYTFTGHLCISEQLEAKQAVLADITEDLGIYDSLEVYEPFDYTLEVVWRT